MSTRTYTADRAGMGQAMDEIRAFLESCRISSKEQIRATLAAEEALGSLVAHGSDERARIKIHLSKFLDSVSIEFSLPGESYAPFEDMASLSLLEAQSESEDVQDAIRTILLRAFAEGMKYRHRGGVNYIRMSVVRSKWAFLYVTLGAMVLGIAAGLLLSAAAPEALTTALDANFLIPIKTMYMNALKMIVAPVVFFSIISCIVQFSDLSEFGRIGGKILGFYLFTTCIAVAVGIGAYYLFQPGNPALAQTVTMADASAITSQTVNVSLKDTIVGIVPTNLIDPFLHSNMLQLIFLAVLCGVATGLIGKYSVMLKDIFQACNDLFLKMTTLIIKVMPAAIFCSITSMMMNLGISSVLSLVGMFGTFLFGLLCMMAVYCLMIVVFGRLTPIPFLRKYLPVMLQVFSMASSNASIPLNMDACEKKLGISGKIYSLSIPLGATLNMDGTCIHLAVFSLALAKSYGIEITSGMMLSVILSIIILSMGAPGIPGSGLICLSVLLAQMNVPVEAIGLVMGIDSMAGMFRTMSNCLGDVAVTTIVAKSEGKLNTEVYSGSGRQVL